MFRTSQANETSLCFRVCHKNLQVTKILRTEELRDKFYIIVMLSNPNKQQSEKKTVQEKLKRDIGIALLTGKKLKAPFLSDTKESCIKNHIKLYIFEKKYRFVGFIKAYANWNRYAL